MKLTRRGALVGTAADLIVKPETAFGTEANAVVAFGVIGTGGRGRYAGADMVNDDRTRLGDLRCVSGSHLPGEDRADVASVKRLMRAADRADK